MKKIYIRLDDIGTKDEKSMYLITQLLNINIPVSCQVVPDWLLKDNCFCKEIINLKKEYHSSLEIFQHGFKHLNHASPCERKYEFGKNRSYLEQYNDILEGKKILLDLLGVNNFTLGFCPPHDRLNKDTLKVLETLNFKYITASKYMFNSLFALTNINFTYFDIDISKKENGIRYVSDFTYFTNFIKNTKLNKIGIVVHGNEFLNIEQCSKFIKIIDKLKKSNKYLFTTIGD